MKYVKRVKRRGRTKVLKDYIYNRVNILAQLIIENKATVRRAAKKFGISKSTVHKDLSERLVKINPVLAKQAREIMDENKMERHIRGGMATKLKYAKEHMQQEDSEQEA